MKTSAFVAHLDGELEETVKDSGLDAVYTGGGTSGPALQRLEDAVAEACRDARRLPDLRLLRYRAHADFHFGPGAGDALLAGKIIVKGREIQDRGRKNRRPRDHTQRHRRHLPCRRRRGWSRCGDLHWSGLATSCPGAPCWRRASWMQTSRSDRETR